MELVCFYYCYFSLLKQKKKAHKNRSRNVSGPSSAHIKIFIYFFFSFYCSLFVSNMSARVCVCARVFVCFLNPISQVHYFLFISCVTVYLWKIYTDDQVLGMMSCYRRIQLKRITNTRVNYEKSVRTQRVHYLYIYTIYVFSFSMIRRWRSE